MERIKSFIEKQNFIQWLLSLENFYFPKRENREWKTKFVILKSWHKCVSNKMLHGITESSQNMQSARRCWWWPFNTWLKQNEGGELSSYIFGVPWQLATTLTSLLGHETLSASHPLILLLPFHIFLPSLENICPTHKWRKINHSVLNKTL